VTKKDISPTIVKFHDTSNFSTHVVTEYLLLTNLTRVAKVGEIFSWM